VFYWAVFKTTCFKRLKRVLFSQIHIKILDIFFLSIVRFPPAVPTRGKGRHGKARQGKGARNLEGEKNVLEVKNSIIF
jgi:hypothetical protein